MRNAEKKKSECGSREKDFGLKIKSLHGEVASYVLLATNGGSGIFKIDSILTRNTQLVTRNTQLVQ